MKLLSRYDKRNSICCYIVVCLFCAVRIAAAAICVVIIFVQSPFYPISCSILFLLSHLVLFYPCNNTDLPLIWIRGCARSSNAHRKA